MLSCECAFFIISTEELSLIVSAYTNTVESIVKKSSQERFSLMNLD